MSYDYALERRRCDNAIAHYLDRHGGDKDRTIDVFAVLSYRLFYFIEKNGMVPEYDEFVSEMKADLDRMNKQ